MLFFVGMMFTVILLIWVLKPRFNLYWLYESDFSKSGRVTMKTYKNWRKASLNFLQVGPWQSMRENKARDMILLEQRIFAWTNECKLTRNKTLVWQEETLLYHKLKLSSSWRCIQLTNIGDELLTNNFSKSFIANLPCYVLL